MRPISKPHRRDFLYIAASSVGVVGLGASAVPFIDQMNPDASAIAAGGPVDVGIEKLAPGQQIVIRWRDHPIFIVSRPKSVLVGLQSAVLVSQLADSQSRELQQPGYADNWHRSIKPEYGVLVGTCTHLGCIPSLHPAGSPGAAPLDEFGGYLCPCHGSKYDFAGRVLKNVPAPLNLPVPPYRFVTDKVIRIGENPPNATFNFSSIEQI